MERRTKRVDTREYVAVLRELTWQGKEVQMLIAGNSMVPFLVHERDWIRFRQPDRPLHCGDMVFYQRRDGTFVMHRICRIQDSGYYLVGDAQMEIEGPIAREQIFGLITAVRRKGKWIEAGDFWWEFFAHVWIRVIPLRGILRRLYGWIRR